MLHTKPYLSWALAVCLGSVLGVTSLTACGDDDHGHSHDDGHDHEHDWDGHPDAECLGDEVALEAGTEIVGEQFAVRILSAAPQPHVTLRLDNTMTVAVSNAQGDPVTGAEIDFDVVTQAPGHGSHGTDRDPELTESAAGEYIVTQLSYVHAGTWLITMTVTAGEVSEALPLRICVRPGEE